MLKHIITIIMLIALPLAIVLNDSGLVVLTAKEWGAFITSYFFILLGLAALVAISDGSNDKL